MIIKMYNCKYRRCCCQKSFDNNMLQDACNNCGVVADYYNENNKNSSCDCGFEESENVFQLIQCLVKAMFQFRQ